MTTLPTFVEGVADGVIQLMRGMYNTWLDVIYAAHTSDGREISLEYVQSSQYYTSEAITPFEAPAVFVVPSASVANLRAQNLAETDHDVFVAIIVEDVEIQRLQRKVWRYAAAAWMTLHDQSTTTLKVLVKRFDYGPTLQHAAEPLGGGRAFRKDVTLRLGVLQYEEFGSA